MSFKAFMNKNGTTIATAGSIVMTVLAVVFAVKKAKEGAEAREEYEKQFEDANDNAQLETEAKIEYGKKLVGVYKEAIIFATGAAVLAFVSHRADAKKITSLGAALALNEDKVRKLYDYIERKFEPKGKTRRDIEKDIAESDPDSIGEKPVKGRKRYRKEEPVTFQDTYTGNMFESTLKDFDSALDRAELILNRRGGYGLGYNKWRSLLGLEDVPAGATTGWKSGEFKAYLQEAVVDGTPVYLICYQQFPDEKYWW